MNYTAKSISLPIDLLRLATGLNDSEKSKIADALQQLAALLRSMEEAKAVAWLVDDAEGKKFTIYNAELAAVIAETAVKVGSTLTIKGVVCVNAPAGWLCTRGAGHEGPCACWPNRPAESAEAKDAARYRYLLTCIDADFGPSLVWACDWSREYGSQLIVDSGQSEANFVSAIDAAMTAESREN